MMTEIEKRIAELERLIDQNATRQIIWLWEKQLHDIGDPRYSRQEVFLMINALIDEAVDLDKELEKAKAKQYEQ